jgi:hypothetical protein
MVQKEDIFSHLVLKNLVPTSFDVTYNMELLVIEFEPLASGPTT